MICNNCGHNNEDGKLNCTWCKFPLAVVPPPAKSIKKTPSSLPAPTSEPPMLEPRTARIHQDSSKPVKGKKTCPQCQYEMILDSDFCPMCSFPFSIMTTESVTSPIQPDQPDTTTVAPPMEEASATPTIPADPIEEPLAVKPRGKSTTSPFRKKPERKMVSATIDPFRRDAANELLATFQPISRESELPMDPITFIYTDKPISLNRSVLEADNNTITGKVQAELEFRDGAWYLVDRSEQETTFVRATGPVKLQKGDVILMGNRKFKFDY